MSVRAWETSPPSGNTQKGYKTQSLTWPTGPPVSRSPCMPPHSAFLLSSLQIKSFQPLLLESACAFIFRVGSRTLNTWNSCPCHLYITGAISSLPPYLEGRPTSWKRMQKDTFSSALVMVWHGYFHHVVP
jgi:hypothetical protein